MFKWGALDTPNSGWTVQNILENQRRDKTLGRMKRASRYGAFIAYVFWDSKPVWKNTRTDRMQNGSHHCGSSCVFYEHEPLWKSDCIGCMQYAKGLSPLCVSLSFLRAWACVEEYSQWSQTKGFLPRCVLRWWPLVVEYSHWSQAKGLPPLCISLFFLRFEAFAEGKGNTHEASFLCELECAAWAPKMSWRLGYVGYSWMIFRLNESTCPFWGVPPVCWNIHTECR